MFKWRLTLKKTFSPFLRTRTSWASSPSQATSSVAYSATPSSKDSREPERTFSSISRLSPESIASPFPVLPSGTVLIT